MFRSSFYKQFRCVAIKVINCLDKIIAALNSNFNAIITIDSYQSCNGIFIQNLIYRNNFFIIILRKNSNNISSLTGFEY